MPVISQSGVMTRCASVDIATYSFETPGEGVLERPIWTLALWLSRDFGVAELGLGPDDTTPWPRNGAVSLIPPGTPLHWRTDGGHIRSVTCRYTLDMFRTLTGLDTGAVRAEGTRLLDLPDAAPIRACMTQMATELASPRHATTLLVESLCVQAAVHLARALGTDGPAPAAMRAGEIEQAQDLLFPAHVAATGGLTPRQLRVVTDNGERIATGEWQVADAAKVCGISPAHLARAFRQSMGTTLGQYLEDVRLRLARGWLAEGAQPIGTIARRLGYAHPSAFSIAFKREVGLSPRIFRKHGGVVPSRIAQPDAAFN